MTLIKKKPTISSHHKNYYVDIGHDQNEENRHSTQWGKNLYKVALKLSYIFDVTR